MSADDLILLFQVLYGVTALGAMVVVISENRNPVKTIAWVLILLLLPLVGLIFYYFFGEDNRKQRLISHKINKKLKSPSAKNISNSIPDDAPEKYRGLIYLLNADNDAPLYEGSSVRFFANGKEKFDVLFDLVRNAKSYIHIQYYIFMDDKLGTELANLLIQKAEEGIEVRLIYDDVGAWKVKRAFFRKMEEHGIQVESFLRVKFRWLTSRVNYRNHRKLVVVDGIVGMMGGMNVADRYLEGISVGTWRDCHIMIEGLAVAGLQNSFLVDWYSSRGEILPREKYYPKLHPTGDNFIQFATSGPVGQIKTIHAGILHAINTSEKSVLIQTPYFIPTDALMLAMQMAALRGVEVKLMLPRRSDTTFVHGASLSFLADVLDVGVEVYFYEIGFLHSKLLVIDDDLTITGSANMDIRSFEHNFEINAFIYNRETCTKAKEIFYKDMENCTLLDSQEWDKRGKTEKFKESVLRLFSPLL